MTKHEIKQIAERRFQEWGSEKISLPSGTCWTLNGEYFKVTTISAFWVLEWTDNLNYAKNGCFEDVDPMPYHINEKIILNEVDKLLLNASANDADIKKFEKNQDLDKNE